MIRERTYTNLLIGLVLSVLIHAYIVMWGPPFSVPTPLRHSSSEVEVQLREWPSPVPAAPPVEAVKIEEATASGANPCTVGKTRAPPEHAGLAGGRANGSDTCAV